MNDTKCKWMSIHDAIPDQNRVVWCVREWRPTNPGSDGSIRTECVLAFRHSDMPLTIDDDPSRYSYWSGLGRKKGAQWADTTVSKWAYVTDPYGVEA